MISPTETRALAEAIRNVERRLQQRMRDGRLSQEEDLTGSLATSLEDHFEIIDGLAVDLRILTSAGRGSAESRFGADICGVLHVDTEDGVRISKGFLVQAKNLGKDGIRSGRHNDLEESPSYGHLLGADSYLDPSPRISIGTPSQRLTTQCKNMLARTPASFVWVYAETGTAVLSAAAIPPLAQRVDRSRAGRPVATRTLSDFFIQIGQCFLGDLRLTAWDDESLSRLTNVMDAKAGMLLRMTTAGFEDYRRQDRLNRG